MGFPNTYTFTKNLAESLVNDHRHELPLAIYRPSIVTYSFSEPEPGYPSSLFGAVGLFIAFAAGILKVVYLSPTARLDMTPYDVGTKCLLYYIYHAAHLYKRNDKQNGYNNGYYMTTENLPVYIFSSSQHYVESFEETGKRLNNTEFGMIAFEKSFLIPGCSFTASKIYYMCIVSIKQILPAMLIDTILKCCGRKSVLLPIVKKLFISLQVMEPFLFNSWRSNGFSLQNELMALNETSICCVRTDVNKATAPNGIINSTLVMYKTVRKVLLKEDATRLPRAQRLLKIKIWLYNMLRIYLAYIIGRWIYSNFIKSYITGTLQQMSLS